jgi:hypothetical protein
MSEHLPSLRICLRDPIPEIFDAARYLDAAVSAHMADKRALADELIRLADIWAINDWSESLWGKRSIYSKPLPIHNAPPSVAKADRAGRRPGRALQNALLERDGFHCRFCGIPLVRRETRALIRRALSECAAMG